MVGVDQPTHYWRSLAILRNRVSATPCATMALYLTDVPAPFKNNVIKGQLFYIQATVPRLLFYAYFWRKYHKSANKHKFLSKPCAFAEPAILCHISVHLWPLTGWGP